MGFQVAELVPATSLAKFSRSFRVAELVRRLPQLTAGEILPHRKDHSALTSVKPVLPRSFQVAELVPATSLAKGLGNLADAEAIVRPHERGLPPPHSHVWNPCSGPMRQN